MEDKLSLMETLRNFTMYANVGRVTADLLPSSRVLSQYQSDNNQ